MTHTITIDWAGIKNENEFYHSFLPQVEAPKWHGKNLDALNDSLVSGQINGVEPPFRIIMLNTEKIDKTLADFHMKVLSILEDASLERGVEVVEK